MSGLKLESKRKLHDGNEIPVLGFGTYELDGKDAYNCVLWALETGYRHVDSADWYDNESECGRAILDYCGSTGIPRAEIFYTTKLKMNNGYEKTVAAIQRSLDRCGLGYIDLYLIHGPLGGPQARLDSWRAICDAQKEGKLKSAGVSCFGVRHLKELEDSNLPLPAMNQIDLHPFMTRVDVVAYCNEHDIALEVNLLYSVASCFLLTGYGGLGSSCRIAANTRLFDFELSTEEISQLDSLDEKLVTDWDPSECP
ncbi:hypothetical protein CCMSSC00406_0008740 [Pleurotus cornucopiae]|uniref:Uncharacterized protein n=1 Tax=Pleurotus cornucopiae TaxID=5321 RepID=A0ACB7J771_PLECO|nr:hypothetical protein CCMSSC00406_0008740 [Pleurotus cornucopiae]